MRPEDWTRPTEAGWSGDGSLAVWGPGLWPPRASSKWVKRVSAFRGHNASESICQPTDTTCFDPYFRLLPAPKAWFTIQRARR